MSLVSGLTAFATRLATEFNTLRAEIPERARDALGTALVAGSGITITPNDVGDTITIAASGSASAAATIVDVTFTTPARSKTVTATVAGATVGQAITATPTMDGLPAGEWELDPHTAAAACLTAGQVTVTVHALAAPITGTRRVLIGI